ncbi:thioredoxin-like protein AAED1, chloroplastic isoform X2 [Tasmannia lanceolata]|uniref:thioredoxin-like protein AAED1, chloroplastic isoform X2 n=1 Tax=Tasmannia lanceolata TaxID=3420 RepID=UPI0040642A76
MAALSAITLFSQPRFVFSSSSSSSLSPSICPLIPPSRNPSRSMGFSIERKKRSPCAANPCCSKISGIKMSWELASTLKDLKPTFDLAGVKLIAIGVGTPDKARILAERLPFPLDSLYADPHRKAYDVLGLYYGLGCTFFNPASAKVFSRFESLQKAVKNYTISATPDDRSSVLQQGGTFVFKGKNLLYARKDEGTGDHAPLDEIIDICCKTPVA